ncbi:MAG: endo alpha-1,4 polygalactosaminidase, partial [Candidatus Eremiobacterota bacterium]
FHGVLSFLRGGSNRGREAFKKKPAQSFYVYYGPPEDAVGRLRDYDMAFVELRSTSDEVGHKLKEDVKHLIAYLSCGEATGDLVPQTPKDAQMGVNRYGWDSVYANPSHPGWISLLARYASTLINRGADGLLLDTVDTVDIFPHIHDGMVELVRMLRKRFPNKILILNRGFSILKACLDNSLIDAVMFETMVRREFNAADREWVENQCWRLKQSGVPTYTINYRTLCDEAECERMAREYGFVYVMSPEQSLMALP